MENYIRIKAEVEELLKSECKQVADQGNNDATVQTEVTL